MVTLFRRFEAEPITERPQYTVHDPITVDKGGSPTRYKPASLVLPAIANAVGRTASRIAPPENGRWTTRWETGNHPGAGSRSGTKLLKYVDTLLHTWVWGKSGASQQVDGCRALPGARTGCWPLILAARGWFRKIRPRLRCQG
jgi:hypothetical protein